MRILVGVDLGERYKPALKLCIDLGFPDQHLTFVHSVVPVPEFAPPFTGEVMTSHLWMHHLRSAAAHAMTEAEKLADSSGLRSTGLIGDGTAASQLMAMADSQDSDLIAVGSVSRSGLAAFFGGSVARALAIGSRQSILVTKGEPQWTKPLKAIFATDHSPYAARVLERLCKWNPKGLERIDVLTAHDEDDEFSAAVKLSLADSKEDAKEWLTSHLSKSNELVSERIQGVGYQSHALVVEGHPSTVIGEQMKERGADLLIVGAQGHGFIERLLVGSVSLHQVLCESYPVLVIRV